MNNNIPQGYKESPLGVIPQDWEVRRLGEVCDNNGDYGINAPAVDYQDSLPTYIRITDIDDNGKYDNAKKVSVDSPLSADYILKEGDIVFARTGATVGKTYLYDTNDGVLVYAGFLIKFSPNLDALNPYILKCITETKPYWGWVKTTSARSGQPGINSKEYCSLQLILPPISEQERIAEVLGCWDVAIEKQGALVDALTRRKCALMQQLLTARKRLPNFSAPWQSVKFKDIFFKKHIKATGNTYDVLSVTKDGIVSQKEYFTREVASEDTSKYLVVERGDLAMSGLNFWMGSCHILTEYENGIISPAYKVFGVSRNFDTQFIKYFVGTQVFTTALLGSSVTGASIVRRNLDKEMLEEWNFNLPSIEEQKSISQILTTADQEIESAKTKLEALRTQKRGLMQQLLTGKKRLKI